MKSCLFLCNSRKFCFWLKNPSFFRAPNMMERFFCCLDSNFLKYILLTMASRRMTSKICFFRESCFFFWCLSIFCYSCCLLWASTNNMWKYCFFRLTSLAIISTSSFFSVIMRASIDASAAIHLSLCSSRLFSCN